MDFELQGLAMPHKKNGYTPIVLNSKDINSITKYLGTDTKKALTFRAVAVNQGMRTDDIRLFANCSNVPQAAQDANKKLLNYGLLLICVSPSHMARNAQFHHWYLVEAPIETLPVQMAVNDGCY